MAKGSHSTYGGWETRVCHNCGRRLTLKDAAMSNYPTGGQPFDLCGDDSRGCIHKYGDAYADMGPAQDVDHADQIHPDQLELTDAP